MHPLTSLIESQRREIHGQANRPTAARGKRERSEARTSRASRVVGLRSLAPVAGLTAAVVLARVLG